MKEIVYHQLDGVYDRDREQDRPEVVLELEVKHGGMYRVAC